MRELAARVLTKTRKRWFKTHPLFESHAPVTSSELERIEKKVGITLPADLQDWLLSVGYGDVDESLSFRYDWFSRVERGALLGAVIFAQDELGNFYAYSPKDWSIMFVSRSASKLTTVAPSFLAFMEELERRDFKLEYWMDSLPSEPYRSDASQETPLK